MITFDEDFVLYDLAEVSELTGVPRYRLEELLRAEDMAGVVHGGRWMVERAEIARFRREWTPPVRRSRVGASRRFHPPPLPAETTAGGDSESP